MAEGKVNNYLVPNVSKLKGHKNVDLRNRLDKNVSHGEFNDLLKKQLGEDIGVHQKQEGISLSTHAAKRMRERNLEMDASEYNKLKDAIGKLKSKGGRDSLVVTDKAAYIVDVGSNKIVTAIERGKMAENVFTKIDSTLFVD